MNETNITKDNYEFIVDITPEDWSRVHNSAVLHLPATQAEFICALDRAGVNGSDFIVEVQDCKRSYLLNIIGDSPDIFELNYLAERLAVVEDSDDSLFFEAVVKMEESPPDIARLINLTYNLENCVLAPAKNLRELGRFAVDGGFFDEFDKLPDKVFEYLDYEALGRRFKDEQGGVIIDGIFVANLAGENDFKTPYNRETAKYTLWMNDDFYTGMQFT